MSNDTHRKRTLIAVASVLLASFAALATIYSSVSLQTNPNGPIAIEGEIDLKSWDFLEDPIPLIGEWKQNNHKHYKTIPSKLEPGVESETYTLKMYLPEYFDDLAVEIPYFPSSSTVSVNGHILTSNGHYSESGKIVWKNTILSLALFDQPIVIKVDVANHGEFFLGGMTSPIKLGYYEELTAIKINETLQEFAYIIIFILYGLFHMSFIRTNNRSTLWMGLYCLQIAGYVLFWQDRQLLSNIDYDWELFQRINFSLIYTGVLSYWLHSLSNHFQPWVFKGTKIVAGVVFSLLLITAVAPIEIVSLSFVYIFAPMLLISASLKVVIFYNAYIEKGSVWLANLLGYAVLAIFAMNDLLNHMEVLTTGLWVGEGLLIYLGIQVYLVQSRYNEKFDETAKLNLELIDRNEQLKIAHESTDLALAQKTQFMAMVGLELRTPILTSYKLIENLECMELPKSAKTFVRMALEDLEPALILIEDISDISGIEYNQLAIRKSSFELVPDLNRLIKQFNEANIKNDISAILNVDYPTTLKKYIYTDQIRINQLISGYFSSTLQHSKPGDKLSVRVQVSESKDNLNRHNMTIELMDQGPGMNDQLKSKLQSVLDNPIEANANFLAGPGMGMAMAKHILDRLEGKVTFRSKAGIGTTFKMVIPVELTSTKEFISSLSLNTTKETTILLVESNPKMRIATKSLMAHVGVSVTAVDCALDATLLFERNQFDMVFVDCYLPKVNGFQMTKQIREIEQLRGLTRTPIIGLYEGNLESVEELAIDAQMDSCMSKPLKKDALFKKIQARDTVAPSSTHLSW